MDLLRSWIISLCTTLIFMTAIELLLPDNSTKKYVKFVLGLILIAVIINPFIRLFTKNTIDINTFVAKYENLATSNTDNSSTTSVTEEKFFSNLEKNCAQLIKTNLSDLNCDVKILGKLDVKATNFDINHIEVYVKDKKVSSLDNTTVNNTNKQEFNSTTSKQIKSILSKELNIDEKKIYVYKGE
ncbi:stage III sporulation protein AF [Clostridium sp. YIM B02505]|uniref:Stage III sporulation protein AF n=1 Tax=Clostridium yunnanense TaxID=2800325 RepID=A0ABS1ENM5_9CLOT|nr:stage III sporulation protein AF [Clostridium yunnanense]MBK1810996.1 stage III sporulation protein AF [Clostridium yunnanense]